MSRMRSLSTTSTLLYIADIPNGLKNPHSLPIRRPPKYTWCHFDPEGVLTRQTRTLCHPLFSPLWLNKRGHAISRPPQVDLCPEGNVRVSVLGIVHRAHRIAGCGEKSPGEFRSERGGVRVQLRRHCCGGRESLARIRTTDSLDSSVLRRPRISG